MKDLYHNLLPEVSLPAAAYTKAGGAVSGEIIDLRGYAGALIECFSGALGDQVNVYELELQHGDEADLSDGVAVAATDILGSEPTFNQAAAESNKAKTFGYIGSKSYVRVDLKAPTGAGTGGGIIGANVIKGAPLHAPVV